MNLLKPGVYKATPFDWGVGVTPTKGTEQIWVTMAVQGVNQEGEACGENITWFGYLTEKAKDRALETIYKLGFDGNFEGLCLGHDSHALDFDQEVIVTVEIEDGKNKIQWINAIGESHGIKRLDKTEAMSIINKFKGDILSKKPVTAKKKGLDLT